MRKHILLIIITFCVTVICSVELLLFLDQDSVSNKEVNTFEFEHKENVYRCELKDGSIVVYNLDNYKAVRYNIDLDNTYCIDINIKKALELCEKK